MLVTVELVLFSNCFLHRGKLQPNLHLSSRARVQHQRSTQCLKVGEIGDDFDAAEFNEALKQAGTAWGKDGAFSSPDPNIIDGLRAEQVLSYPQTKL